MKQPTDNLDELDGIIADIIGGVSPQDELRSVLETLAAYRTRMRNRESGEA